MTTKDLHRFRNRLVTLRDRLTGEVLHLTETALAVAQPAGEHDHGVSEAIDKELILEQNEEQMRRDVAEALARIEAGTYGRCRFCGRPIEMARLDALPYAPYCIECEQEVEAAQ
jgi:RNA polymerase-binding transcription factor DksA